MPPFGFLSRIDWDYVAKVWLPLTTAIEVDPIRWTGNGAS
jgi:hypothetical protein